MNGMITAGCERCGEIITVEFAVRITMDKICVNNPFRDVSGHGVCKKCFDEFEKLNKEEDSRWKQRLSDYWGKTEEERIAETINAGT